MQLQAAHRSFIGIDNRLNNASEAERQSFSDALDASREMIAMSQSDIAPRNIYGHSNSSGSAMEQANAQQKQGAMPQGQMLQT